jgi:hypothetical protein
MFGRSRVTQTPVDYANFRIKRVERIVLEGVAVAVTDRPTINTIFRPHRSEGFRFGVSHISRKTSEMPRISCSRRWTRPRGRPSLGEGRMKFADPLCCTGNRGCGAPIVRGGTPWAASSKGIDQWVRKGAKTFEGLRPVFFGPGTLWRTWGTRPYPSRIFTPSGFLVGHESACVGSIDDAMIEAQRQTDDAAHGPT